MSEKSLIFDAHAMLGEEFPFHQSATELLARMDANGVSLAAARPMGRELVIDSRAGNDRVLGAGPRVKAWVSVNPWQGRAGLDELRRCRDAGAVGLFLHPSRQGFMPIEPVVAPALELAAGFEWPVMFHTGSYVQSDVLAVAEVARRYPGTRFVMGFAGYTDMWFELPGVFAATPNLWIDASMIWSEAVVQMVEAHGPSRIVFGGAEPRNRYEVLLRALRRQDRIGPHLPAILGGNAMELFGIKPEEARRLA